MYKTAKEVTKLSEKIENLYNKIRENNPNYFSIVSLYEGLLRMVLNYE